MQIIIFFCPSCRLDYFLIKVEIITTFNFILKSIFKSAITSTTREENHKSSDMNICQSNGRGYGIEVKSVNAAYEEKPVKLFPSKNKNWLRTIGDINPKYRYWMLNLMDNSNYLGKGLKVLKERSGLVYIFRDGILFYGPTSLEDSIAGIGVYYCTQRQMFEKKLMEETPQWKMIINLEYGRWIPCDVPEDFFEQVNYEDFNRENSKG